MLSFSWPLREEAPSIFNVATFCKKKFEKELIRRNDIAINPESQAF
jgi:hypothetical protein